MTDLTIAPEIRDAIETMLCVLAEQLTKSRTATALAHDYHSRDKPQTAFGTLLSIEAEIDEAACLLKAILTLYRNQRPAT